MSKYLAKKIEVDGHLFDSKKEAKRYMELKDMQDRGEIDVLRIQVPYELIPTQRIDGKVVERPMKYVADFVYEKDGETIVEDVKGYRKGTAYSVFVCKRKEMLYRYGIKVKEI